MRERLSISDGSLIYDRFITIGARTALPETLIHKAFEQRGSGKKIDIVGIHRITNYSRIYHEAENHGFGVRRVFEPDEQVIMYLNRFLAESVSGRQIKTEVYCGKYEEVAPNLNGCPDITFVDQTFLYAEDPIGLLCSLKFGTEKDY